VLVMVCFGRRPVAIFGVLMLVYLARQGDQL